MAQPSCTGTTVFIEVFTKAKARPFIVHPDVDCNTQVMKSKRMY